MNILFKAVNALKNEIKIWSLLRGIIALFPFAFLYLSTDNPLWIQASVLTMATLIVEERLELTALGVLLHGMIVIIMFYLLFLTQLKPVLYVISCSLAAMTIFWITMKGNKLRHLGSWTFIPAIILATEFAAETQPEKLLQQAPQFLPYFLVALLPSLLIAHYDKVRAFYKKQVTHYHPLRLSGLGDFGEQNPYIENMISMAVAVCISAFLVEYFHMDNGQWTMDDLGNCKCDYWRCCDKPTKVAPTRCRSFHWCPFRYSPGAISYTEHIFKFNTYSLLCVFNPGGISSLYYCLYFSLLICCYSCNAGNSFGEHCFRAFHTCYYRRINRFGLCYVLSFCKWYSKSSC